MLHLIELSIPLALIQAAAINIDPLTAADDSYAIKTWLSLHAGVAIRPWRAFTAGTSVRLVGWRAIPPDTATLEAVIYHSHREFTCREGETINLIGTVVPLRRTTRNGNVRRSRDAAEGYEDHGVAYEAWLRERLIDVTPHFECSGLSILSCSKRRVLRKFGQHSRQVVREQIVPVVTAQISGRIKSGAGLEDWLLKGIGPQKAFGFGAFFPC